MSGILIPIVLEKITWRYGIAEVNVALRGQGDEALQVVGLFNCIRLSPICSMLAIVFGCIQVAVHSPILEIRQMKYRSHLKAVHFKSGANWESNELMGV